uniref:Protein FAM177A1 n=1 Tax=Ciona savignyi TaxID=51511 RepID=H2ZND0_CIOSA
MQSVEEKSKEIDVMQDTTVLCGDNLERFKLNKDGKVKIPRRLIHCSDGVLEEYSTDEEEEETEENLPLVDPSTLSWGSYLWFWTVKSAFSGLAACDYLGEKFANFFGITSPKYQYELNQLKQMEEEEQEIEKEERAAEEMAVQEALRVMEAPVLKVPDVTVRVEGHS